MRFKKELTVINGKNIFYWEKNPIRAIRQSRPGSVGKSGKAGLSRDPARLAQEKMPVVFLHGFPGSHKGLIELASRFDGYRLIVPDLPACGASEPLKESHGLKDYANWVSDFLESLSIGGAIVVGHSFGARVALMFGAKHPQKVYRLVLITPVVKVDSLIGKIGAFYYRIAKIMPASMRREWLSNKIYCGIKNRIILKSASHKKRKYLLDINIEEVKNLNKKIEIEIFDEFYKSELISQGGKINIKTLIIASDQDEIATINSVKELRQRFTNDELVVMKNSGHLVPLERPLATAKVIESWLETAR